MLSFFKFFLPIFPEEGGQLSPFAPMCGRSWSQYQDPVEVKIKVRLTTNHELNVGVRILMHSAFSALAERLVQDSVLFKDNQNNRNGINDEAAR